MSIIEDFLLAFDSRWTARWRLYIEIVGNGIPLLPSPARWHQLDKLNGSLQHFEFSVLDVVDVLVSKLKRLNDNDLSDIAAMVVRPSEVRREPEPHRARRPRRWRVRDRVAELDLTAASQLPSGAPSSGHGHRRVRVAWLQDRAFGLGGARHLQSISIGGKDVSAMVQLCDKARNDALFLMIGERV